MDSRLPSEPIAVETIRILGKGRAAVATLVEATMKSGEKVRCVEKRFTPGWLTRCIYRLSFQSPFAYQSNRNAILTAYYRRLVASQILAGLNFPSSIAAPLYVRFDRPSRSWVLAAEWIQGRGIRPTKAMPTRPGRITRRLFGIDTPDSANASSEMSEILNLMSRLEAVFRKCGLMGTGWQVSPNAMVSTANLLRESNQYTVIDLESGIPAVLVPKYIVDGIKQFQLPPFDEINERRINQWFNNNRYAITDQIGNTKTDELEQDIARLVNHHKAWKESEIAIFRTPQKWLSQDRRKHYFTECIRRWKQDRILKEPYQQLNHHRVTRFCFIWIAGLIPGRVGRFLAKLIGNHGYRRQVQLFITQPQFRKRTIYLSLHRRWNKLKTTGRIKVNATASWSSLHGHRFLSQLLPITLHRFLSDKRFRNHCNQKLLLLMNNHRYQVRYGTRKIRRTIRCWEKTGRMNGSEANQLRTELSTEQMRHYLRGFGLHLGLKCLTPLMTPLKIAGLASFYESNNLIYLAPLIAMPIARAILTTCNAWISRSDQIPHRLALILSWTPVLGTLAFPFQMYASSGSVSRFLIRDFASQVGQKLPIYGGKDSRMEIALIQSTDWIFWGLSIFTNKEDGKKTNETGDVTPTPMECENRFIKKDDSNRLSSHQNQQDSKKNQRPLAA